MDVRKRSAVIVVFVAYGKGAIDMKEAVGPHRWCRAALLLAISAAALAGHASAARADAMGSVAGTIRRIDGSAARGVTVTLTAMPAPGRSGAPAARARTRPDGTYDFSGVEPGAYVVSVSGGDEQPASAPVVVQQDFSSDADLTLAPRVVAGVTRLVPSPTQPGVYVVSSRLERRVVTRVQSTVSPLLLTATHVGEQPGSLYQATSLTQGQPGVTPDPWGNSHVHGADINETGYELDGVQVRDPMTNRVGNDSVNVGLRGGNPTTLTATDITATFEVDAQGRAHFESMQPSTTGDAAIDAAIRRAVENARFTPAKLNGLPIAVEMTHEFVIG